MQLADKHLNKFPSLIGLGGALGLLALAIGFPQADVVAWQFAHARHVADPAWLHAAVMVLRIFFAVDAVLLIWWARRRMLTSRSPAGLRRPLAAREEWQRLVPVLVVAAALRFWQLDSDLWLDEIATVVNFARGDFAACLTTYPSANHHPLNSLLVWMSVSVLGDSNWSVRLPAALFGIAGVGAMYFLARTVTSAREALLATILLACSWHHVYYSQSARGYAGYLLGTMLGTAFFARLLRAHQRRDATAYIAAMLAGFFCHPNTLFVWGAHNLVLLLVWLFPARARRCGMSAGWDALAALALVAFGTLQFYLLMLPEMIGYFRSVDTTAVGYAPLSSLFWSAFARGMKLGPAGALAVVGLLAVVGAGLVSHMRQNRWIGLLCILPLNLGLVTALILHAPIYPRYFLFGLPVGLLLLVRGMRVLTELMASRLTDELRRERWARRAGVVASATVLIAVALPLVNYYRVPKQPYTQALAFASKNQSRPARTVAIDLAVHGCRYYEPHVATAASLAELNLLEAAGDDLWVLYTFAPSLKARQPDLYAHLAERYQVVRTFPAIVGDGAIHVGRSLPSRLSTPPIAHTKSPPVATGGTTAESIKR